MILFDCVELRDKMEEKIKAYTDMCKTLGINVPYLNVITVGEDGANNSYVNSKEKACKRTGIIYYQTDLDRDTTQEWLVKKIKEANNNNLINGLIVQFPIDSKYTISKEAILDTIDPRKDVDGLTPTNMGKLALGQTPIFLPCTAKGVVDILKKQLDMSLVGKHVVILGKGMTSGRPLSLLLPQYGATVTVLDSKTSIAVRRLALKNADIIISCTGVEGSLDVHDIDHYKDTIVINVGMSRNKENKLVGDVDIESIVRYEERFKYPVSTTVNTVTKSTGIMTVTNLLFNTCLAHLLYEVPTEHFNTLHEIIGDLY